MNHGKVIYLNGASSSGKTSIAKALQNKFEAPFIHFSIDGFFEGMPSKFIDILSGKLEPSESDIELLQTYFPRALNGFHAAVNALALEGNNLIVDYIFESPQDLHACVNRLSNHFVWFVGVHCDLQELVRRENQRDRRQGLAKHQFEVVHAHGIYDFQVDTTSVDSEQCAKAIKTALEESAEPTAFKKLRNAT